MNWLHLSLPSPLRPHSTLRVFRQYVHSSSSYLPPNGHRMISFDIYSMGTPGIPSRIIMNYDGQPAIHQEGNHQETLHHHRNTIISRNKHHRRTVTKYKRQPVLRSLKYWSELEEVLQVMPLSAHNNIICLTVSRLNCIATTFSSTRTQLHPEEFLTERT